MNKVNAQKHKNAHCRKNAILASLQNFCNGCIIAEKAQYPL